jgi:ABC-type glycerol-3-phosphate transport system permease component
MRSREQFNIPNWPSYRCFEFSRVPERYTYISSFKTSEGLFWAKMSAGATVTVLPVVIAGWIAQRQLVAGLTAGAVKA